VQRAALKHPRPADARSPSRDSWPFRCGLLPEASSGPFHKSLPPPWEWAATAHPPGKHVRIQRTNFKKELQPCSTKSSHRPSRKEYRSQNRAEQEDYAVLNIATSESWKNDKGNTKPHRWHRVYAWGNLSNFAKTLLKGQLVSLEGRSSTGRSRKMSRQAVQAHNRRDPRFEHEALSKVEAADDPADGADAE